MRIVVDTNILIDFSRKKIKKEEIVWPKLVKFSQKEGHQLILPSVCLFELFAGREMEEKDNQEKMEDVLSDIIVLDLTPEVAKEAARLFRKYQANIGPIDYFLAATTFVLEGELATLNPKHFKIFSSLLLTDFSRFS